ncbi:killer cell immunoglobulin-like receptor 3DL1 isoform X2 [Peromyscus leucopus]|uniref:killer cell immunoglobulin-like receptor 3DL1 isoform X2 n=1 Tax=Peromyscus leucopus TaxID=10041 RepID=UPI0018853E81|nr:killer cell immunoglobulin-like receptor 3DL1 isoform X2 [Peromyscus leucopus]
MNLECFTFPQQRKFVYFLNLLKISASYIEAGMFQFREKCYTKDPKEEKIGVSALRDEGASLNIFSVHSSAGYHEKPSLSAWPSHIVPLGQHVELRCDSHSNYYKFKLYKEHGNPIPQIQGRPFQKKIVLDSVTSAHAGTYRCYGLNFHYPIKISDKSDPVEIIISGIYKKPFLLALQPPLVNLGEKVTLECRSEIMFETFILTSHKNGTIKDSFKLSAEHHRWDSQANFSIAPVTPDHAGTYKCYGSYNHSPYEWSDSSDPIDIKITGLYKKPSLSAQMGPMVMSGENMTLSCASDLQFDMFHLSREGVPEGYGLPAVQNQNETFQADFILGPVVPGGNYRCYGSFRNSSHVWSTPSDPLHLLVTGLYKKPFLSALMGPVVMSGENMTLSCVSDLQFDMFHLSREGVPKEHGLPSVKSHNGTFQANFHLGPVVQAGNYRCYGSFRNSSYLWSTPSDPLYLPVTENHRNLHMLIGLSVTMILAFLIILLYSWCSAKKSKSQEQASECHLSSVRKQDQRNRAIMGQESEVRATLNRQDPEREEVQEVTYLKFDQMIFKQKLTTPESQIPKEFSTDPSLYMEVRKC